MMPNSKFNSIFFLFLYAHFLFSQDVLFRRFSAPDGTKLPAIVDITQDPQGYMWFSSFSGVYKFDGYRFVHFQNDPLNPNSLMGNTAECIRADQNGMIWIGTWIGLDRLDPKTGFFTHYAYHPDDPASISAGRVTSLLVDHEGMIWVGTHSGLNKLDQQTGKFIRYQHIESDSTSISNDQVRALYEDRNGTIWAGCGSPWVGQSPPGAGGLNKLDRTTGKITRYLHRRGDSNSLLDNHIRAIFEDSRRNFWVGTSNNGLHTLDRSTGLFKRHIVSLSNPEGLYAPPPQNASIVDDHITFITEDAVGDFWLGTVNSGLNRLDSKNKKVSHYASETRTHGFGATRPWCSFSSRDGIMWISTVEGQLYSLDPFEKTIPYSEIGSNIRAMIGGSGSRLWIGSEKGLFRKDLINGKIKHFVHADQVSRSLSDNYISALYEDRNGTLWVGASGDRVLNRYDQRNQNFIHYKHSVQDTTSFMGSHINALYEDHQGGLWIAMNEGLDRMDVETGKFRHYKNNPVDSQSIHSGFIGSIAEDHMGNIWLGSKAGGGIDHFNVETGHFNHFLEGATVVSILYDSERVLWVATKAGLYISKDLVNFSRFILPGLEKDIGLISSMLADDHNNIFIQCSEGFIKLNAKRDRGLIYNIAYNDGDDLNFVSCKGENGIIYFAGKTGYYSFSPELFATNPNPPQVNISRIYFHKSQDLGDQNPISEIVFPTADDLSLKYTQNDFSIDFTGIHFGNSQDNNHLFMLENYDKNWRQSGSEHAAHYYQVPPGKYNFRVKAASSDGVWGEGKVSFRIRPPWWRTWWSYVIYGLILISGVFAIDRFQKQRLIRGELNRRQALELTHAREIEKAYNTLKKTQAQLIQSEKMASLGELTAGIAHEIQNPLNFVNNFAEINKELLDEIQGERRKDPDAYASGGGRDDKAEDELLKTIRENLEKISFHGKKADGIVKSMLQHSRSSEQSGKWKKEPTDINMLADEYLRLAYHGFRAKDQSFNATLETDFDPTIGLIQVIPQDIARAMLNLITNAFQTVQEKLRQGVPSPNESFREKAPPALGDYQPTVSLNTQKTSDTTVEIRVKDNGMGIPQNVLDKIFQPFFTTKPTGQGTGLGLSLTYDIVKAHQGEIKVDSREGEGSTFTVILPVV